MLEGIYYDINHYFKTQKILVEEVQKLIKDKSIPLNDRWELFSKSSFLPNSDYGGGYVDTLGKNITLHEDYYFHRYQTVPYVCMVDEHSGVYYTEDSLEKWKEKVLENGHYSFTYNW